MELRQKLALLFRSSVGAKIESHANKEAGQKRISLAITGVAFSMTAVQQTVQLYNAFSQPDFWVPYCTQTVYLFEQETRALGDKIEKIIFDCQLHVIVIANY